MTDLNLTPLLRKHFEPYPRKRGRYNSSELFRIARGYLKPEEWAQPRPWGLPAMLGMWNGRVVHDYIERLLPREGNEVKIVYEHNITPTQTIQLVAKADHCPPHLPSEVWEFKTSKEGLKKSKPEHEYQLKLYCTIHQKQKGVIYQPVQNGNGLFLKNIGEVSRDDNWFREQMTILEEFHKKVEVIWEDFGGELPDPNATL